MSDFTQYDRITDILMYFTNEITLTFVVALSRLGYNHERKFFHYEIEKQSQNRGEGSLYNIKRNMNFFFTIDFKNDFTNNIILRPRDVQMLNDIVARSILPWYQAGTKDYAFQIVDKNLALTEYRPVIYTQSEIKYIHFEPSVITDEDGKDNFGININFSGKYYVQITLEKFMDFVYLLHSDMYSVAASLCNYAKIDPYGLNIFKPYGLGGGRVEDQFGGPIEDSDIQAGYTSTYIDNTRQRNDIKQMTNSFLENSKSKDKKEKK